MSQAGNVRWVWVGAVMAALVVGGTVKPGLAQQQQPAGKAIHVPEAKTLLGNLRIDKPRTHKNMIVFPIRFGGKQAPGDWATLDDAVAAGHLKVTEKDQASVPEVRMENTGTKTVFLMSGEIVKGGKQSRVVRKDTVIEAKQQVAVAVLCIERSRWAGGKRFTNSANIAPANIQGLLKSGASQGRVWEGVRGTLHSVGAESRTESLDEGLNSPRARKAFGDAHKDLGKFSPPDTVGMAVADARTGRVVGLELFGRRDLFERLQSKLIEGYTTDLVLAAGPWKQNDAKKVNETDVRAFIDRAIEGTSRYEDTPGSGRGIDLVSGTLRGKGVALGSSAIHLSIQDLRPAPTPARPIVNDPRQIQRPQVR